MRNVLSQSVCVCVPAPLDDNDVVCRLFVVFVVIVVVVVSARHSAPHQKNHFDIGHSSWYTHTLRCARGNSLACKIRFSLKSTIEGDLPDLSVIQHANCRINEFKWAHCELICLYFRRNWHLFTLTITHSTPRAHTHTHWRTHHIPNDVLPFHHFFGQQKCCVLFCALALQNASTKMLFVPNINTH